MINLNAKQIGDPWISHMDNATLLSATGQISLHVQHSAVARQKLGTIADTFVSAADAYDVAYNPSRKDLLSDVLEKMNKVRDYAQTAWHENILAAQRSPNEQKAMVARQLVQYYKDYKLDTADEYMKQTTNIQQMIQAIEANATVMALLPSMGLDDYLTDLKQKNEAFLAKMMERTAGTVGREKGTVAAARAAVEKALRDLILATNVVSIYEGDGSLDEFIDTMNAEVGHYRQILARKGYGSGSSSSGSGSSGSGSSGSGSSSTGQGGSSSEQGSGSTEQGSGSTDQGGSSSEQGSGSTDQGGSSSEQGSGSSEQGGGSDTPPSGGGGGDEGDMN